ncbi:MAG: cation diffusion facilitator family transporter [Clostridiales bacterium]|nr:cation diffusion facilitator family transporter [Clostridiales bacterium]
MTAKRNKTTTSPSQPLDETAIIRNLSLVSVVGNVVLSGFKLFAGIVGHSGAMISDAIHSFSDVLTTLIAWIGVKVSKREADNAHPYGHERLECVASLLLGLVLLATGIGIGKVGAERILSGNYETLAVPSAIALAAAVVSIVGKEAMYWYTRYYAKQINSTAFLADAWHHRSDAFSSVGSLIGIGGAMLGFPVMDSVASVVICLFIVKVAWDISKDALVKMLDTSCGQETLEKMTALILAQPGVEGLDLLQTRLFGAKIYVDAEIAVQADLPLRQAHAIAEAVHDAMEEAFPMVKHCMVHVNPANP